MKPQSDFRASLASPNPGPAVKRWKSMRKPGFALVATLTLMILLTMVAVGLLSLSAISLRQSRDASALAVAQNNARLALYIALGELQSQAGSDQRVTGIADLAGTATGDAIAAGAAPANLMSVNEIDKGLSSIQPGTRYWTGVWRNTATNPATEIFTATPSPVLTKWLVSGNETQTSTGLITPASQAHAVSSNGDPGNPDTTVILAGRNTIGMPSAETIQRYVTAPLVPIRVGNEPPTGRYAWWIGDEGVKARINLPKSNEEAKSYASLTAQRRGWETVAGFASYPDPTSPLHASLAKVITLDSGELLLPASQVSASGDSPLQSAFHSATTDSRGLITDTLAGGTRIDLDAILALDLPATNPLPGIANYPTRNGNLLPPLISRNLKGPRWNTVKEFRDRVGNLSGGNLSVKPASNINSASLAPTVIDFRILMGVKFIQPTPPPRGGATTFKVHACGKVAIAIANPYPYPLEWKNDLEFEVKSQTPPGNGPSRVYPTGFNCVFIPRDNTEAAVFNKAVFRIRPATLAPGEARAYTIGSNNVRKIGTGNQRMVVDLEVFKSSSPNNFNNCVELEVAGDRTPPFTLDVRESWQTTLVMLEMRLAGGSASSQPLRRIERFELDNGYFFPNQRTFTLADCQKTLSPVPLMLYSFQISQPGAEYIKLMPAGYSWGQRGSTLRTFADFNLQAANFSKPITSYNPPPFFMESNDSRAQLPSDPPGGDTGFGFARNLVLDPLPWGWAQSPVGSRYTVLFSMPTDFSSLAQLQHVDLTADEVTASIGHQPGNAFANSYATPFVRRSLTQLSRTDYELIGINNRSGANLTTRVYFDMSYLLNAALWDTYFLSTIPPSGQAAIPRSPAIMRVAPTDEAALRDPVAAAAQLMIDGAFNINSTDKTAWKAFLASARHFKHPSDPAILPDAAFPRSLEQPGASANPPTGAEADSFSGFRRLNDRELDALATEIVRQIRLRGPFISISHFVNRAIADITKHPTLTRSGALQSAIDESGLNINHAGDKNVFTKVNPAVDVLNLSEISSAPAPDMDGGDTADRPTDVDPRKPDWAARSRDNNFGSVASIVADREMIKDGTTKREQGYRSTGIPGWLTQADVLQVIGSSIAARSDTFRIRAYGEALNPDGSVAARAWCEAVVQRMPEYVDPANAATDRVAVLTPLNRIQGRAFQISSFRWLSSDEI
jgi:Tfp pilus assembly protein PilX